MPARLANHQLCRSARCRHGDASADRPSLADAGPAYRTSTRSRRPGSARVSEHFRAASRVRTSRSVPRICGGLGCYSSITSASGGHFQLVNATVAAGYSQRSLTVLAYANGSYVGSQTYTLTTDVQTLTFPQGWGNVTEVVLQGSSVTASFVLYSITIN